MTTTTESTQTTDAAAPFRALLIGIDGYPRRPLRGCVNDIQAFAEFLRTELQVPDTAITRMLAPNGSPAPDAELLPTKARIIAELQAIAAEPELAHSQVLIYYSGHGTQRYFSQAEANYEALVPMDYAREPATLLFDFEIAPLFQAIAARCRALTVILDCCNSAGILSFPAPDDEESRGRDRFLPNNDRADAPLPVPPEKDAASHLRWSTEISGSYTILAAAQSDEPAQEIDNVDPAQGPRGALSYALLRLLTTEFRSRLRELRWGELWQPLRAELRRLGISQHPHFLGSLGKGILSPDAAPYDHALPVQPASAGGFELGGGELAGLGPEATVAVYPPFTPPTFAPLGSPQDLADRLGVVVVTSSNSQSALAEPMEETTLALSGPGRGRLLSFGKSTPLQVGFASSCPEWVQTALQQQASVLGIRCLPLAAAGAQAAADTITPELVIGQSPDGALLLGDAVYPCDPDNTTGPLGTIPVPMHLDEPQRQPWMLRALRAAFQHYSQYAVPARLVRLAERPDSPLPSSSLELWAVSGSDPQAVSAMVQDARQIQELHRDPNGRVPIQEGAPVCFRIHNNSWFPLFVALVLCDSQGRLRLLAPPQQIAASAGSFIWPSGFQIGTPFQFERAGRPVSIARVFALATNSPDTDFRWLETRLTLAQAIAWDSRRVSFVEAPPPPPLTWTAVELQLAVGST